MGLFITIEGPNGVGKTSFVNGLSEALAPRSIFVTKEPSVSAFGQYVKKNEGSLCGKSYAYLIAADRCNHIENNVVPALKNYDIVLCDRYIESSLVLQRFDGVNIDLIWKLNEEFLMPYLSIILIADESVLQYRLSQRKELSSYEKRMTRSEELSLYSSAHDYICQKGYNSIVLQNNFKEDMQRNIDYVLQIIRNREEGKE